MPDPKTPIINKKNTDQKSDNIFDVIIIGGGLAGLTLANAINSSLNKNNKNNKNIKIALLEAKNMNLADNNIKINKSNINYLDDRYIALSLNSKLLLNNINIWDKLNNKSTPIQNIEVSDQGGLGKTYLSSKNEDLPALGYNLIIQNLGEALLDNIKNINNISLFENTKLTNINNINPNLSSININNNKQIFGKLIIATDGANSYTRKLLNLKAKTKSFNQHAVITTIALKRPHTDTAYERFTPDGPIGLIPCIVNNNKTQMSLVWATNENKALELANTNKKDFLEQLQINFGYKCGKFIDCGKRTTYPLTQTIMPKQYKDNILFIGNAAHTLHPVAGQGFNLSLTEIMQLTDIIKNNNLENSQEIIKEFIEKTTKNQNSIISITEDLINIFSNNTPIIKQIRRFALNQIDQIKPIKTRLNQKMMGLL